MTVKQLQEYLKQFSSEAKVVIWEWDNPNPGDNTLSCEIGANTEHQLKTQTVQLYRGFPE